MSILAAATRIRNIVNKTVPFCSKEVSTPEIAQFYEEIQVNLDDLVAYVKKLVCNPWDIPDYLPNASDNELGSKLSQALRSYECIGKAEETKQIGNIIERLFQLPLRSKETPFDFQDSPDYICSKDINPQLAFITRVALLEPTREAVTKLCQQGVRAARSGKVSADPSLLLGHMSSTLYTSKDTAIYDYLFDRISNSEDMEREKDLLLLTGFSSIPEKYVDQMVEVFKNEFLQDANSSRNNNLRLAAFALSKFKKVPYDSNLVEYCNILLNPENSQNKASLESNRSTALYTLMNIELNEEQLEEHDDLFNQLVELVKTNSRQNLKFIPYAALILSQCKSFSEQQLDDLCDLLGSSSPVVYLSGKAILANYLRQADPEKREMLENKLFDKLLDPLLEDDSFYGILHLISLSPTQDIFKSRFLELREVSDSSSFKNQYIAAFVAFCFENQGLLTDSLEIVEDGLKETDPACRVLAFRLLDLLGPQFASKLVGLIRPENTPENISLLQIINARMHRYREPLMQLLVKDKDKQDPILYLCDNDITPLNLSLRQNIDLMFFGDQSDQVLAFLYRLVGGNVQGDERKRMINHLLAINDNLGSDQQGFLHDVLLNNIDTDSLAREIQSVDPRYKLAEFLLRLHGYTSPCTSV